MNILLTGPQGQVGTALRPLLEPLGTLTALGRDALDLADADAIRAAVQRHRPQLIVNAAAYTAVDRAETEPELAQAINGVAPGVLAEEAGRLGAALIHYSTDYVFDGSHAGPYVETDPPHPLGVYGRSKWMGEQTVLASGTPAWIFRTSWVYGLAGANFLKTMLRLGQERESLNVVNDQWGAPTWARSIAEATATLVQQARNSEDGEIRPFPMIAASSKINRIGSAAITIAATKLCRAARVATFGRRTMGRSVGMMMILGNVA